MRDPTGIHYTLAPSGHYSMTTHEFNCSRSHETLPEPPVPQPAERDPECVRGSHNGI